MENWIQSMNKCVGPGYTPTQLFRQYTETISYMVNPPSFEEWLQQKKENETKTSK